MNKFKIIRGVRCRKLEPSKVSGVVVIKEGDFFQNPETNRFYPTKMAAGHCGVLGIDYYRPLKSPKPRAKVRGFIAYGLTSKVGKFIRFEMTLDLCEGKQFTKYRITPITPRKTRAKK
jgi:hypothetical protein